MADGPIPEWNDERDEEKSEPLTNKPRFLRQIVFGDEVLDPRPMDYGDAIEFGQKLVLGHPKLTLWTVQNGVRKSGVYLCGTTCVRISIV